VATRVAGAAKTLEIEELMQRKPRQLSGGQRQRVAIGRAIVREPKAFLFDEPLSNLDAELRVQMRIEIAKLHQQLGATMVYVTHDQVEAMTLADRIVVLRAGIVEQQGSPIELYDNPDNIFVAGFIGSPRMNFVAAEIATANGRDVEVRLKEFGSPTIRTIARSDRAKPGMSVSVGIRPEHFIDAAGAPVKLTARSQVVEQLGGVSYVYAASETGAQITVQQRGHSAMATDSIVAFGIDPKACLLFDEGGKRV
jgi:lactose/L-arabinose transport system ATP-binding protein